MNKLKKNKKLIIIILSITLVLISLLGTSYALIYKEKVLEAQNSYTTGNLQLSLTSGTTLNLTNVFPMSDAEGSSTTPYTFTVENTGTITYKYDLNLVTTTTENVINPDYIKIKIDDNTPVTLSSINEVLYQNLYLEEGKSQTFNIRIWLDENTPNSEIGKSYSAKITMDGESVESGGKVEGFVELVMAKQAKSDADIDFTQTSKSTKTNGIYRRSGTENDVHPIYYYRGAVDNNLIFAGFCWKIVRSTETGGIKILYNGLPSGGHCDNTGEESQIGENVFNETSDSLAYVGYMYGIPYRIGMSAMSSTTNYTFGNSVSYSNGKYTLVNTKTDTWANLYNGGINNHHYICLSENGYTCNDGYVGYAYLTIENAIIYVLLTGGVDIKQAMSNMLDNNDTPSTIKGDKNTAGTLDHWYYNNIENTTYKNYIEDTVWCYDRNIEEHPGGFNPNGGKTYLNQSASSMEEIFEPLLMFPDAYRQLSGQSPKLTCDRNQDRFTVNNSNGNRNLDYPVGLITLDEIVLAGGTTLDTNDLYYLYPGTWQEYWGGSPFGIVSNYASVSFIRSDGDTGGSSDVHDAKGVRPAISLKPGTMFNGGSGKTDDPYIVE